MPPAYTSPHRRMVDRPHLSPMLVPVGLLAATVWSADSGVVSVSVVDNESPSTAAATITASFP